MTFTDALTVWRELLDVERCLVALRAMVEQPTTAHAWRAALVALEFRREVLAAVLSLERQELLDAVYAHLADDPHPEMNHGSQPFDADGPPGRIH